MRYRVIYVLMIIAVALMALGVFTVEEYAFHARSYQHEFSESEISYTAEGITTHLPVVSIHTKDQKIPGTPLENQENVYELAPNGENSIVTEMKIYTAEESDPLDLLARVRYRGNSSRYFSKKSYAVRLVNEKDEERKEPLLGMEKHDEWVLHGPYLDRSLLRNYLALNLSGEIMSFAPDVRYVELFVDGSYEGVYLLMETITKGEGRVEISTPSRNSRLTSYILEMDRPLKMKPEFTLYDFLTYTFRTQGKGFEVVYPGANQYTEDRIRYVEQDFSNISKFLYERPLEDSTEEIAKVFDIQAFQDYFIINELFRNVDAGFYSTFLYKDVRGLLTPVVWDFNNSLDNYQEISHPVHGFSLTGAVFFETLLKDEDFVEGLLKRYEYLRETVLKEERLVNLIDETVDYLGTAVERNDERWGSIYDLSNYNVYEYLERLERNVTSHEEAVAQMKEYLLERGRWLDEHMVTLKQYSHPSRNAFEMIR